MPIIDTHAHMYSDNDAQYPTTTAFDPFRPSVGIGTSRHLRAVSQSAGVDRVVVVHTTSMYNFDNRLLSDTVDANRGWTVGVCTLDPMDPGSVGLLESYVRTRNVRGLRLTDASGDFGHDGHRRLFEVADRLGVIICALANVQHRDPIAKLLAEYSGVRLVLDHCLNLRAGDEATLRAVRDLASFPNAHAKMTFAVTGSDEAYPCRDTHDYIHRIVEAYGSNRCMWGSDFPCELWCPKVTYAQHLAIYTQEAGLSADTRANVVGGTAMRLWFS